MSKRGKELMETRDSVVGSQSSGREQRAGEIVLKY